MSEIIETPAEALARARSDILSAAREVHAKCLLGQVDPRTAETQRKAALDVMAKDYLQHLSDEALLAELRRRDHARDQ